MKEIIPEKVLVEKCRQNNSNAQRELFNRYKNAMYTLAFRMLNNEDEAHDALQEAFISVFVNIRKFRGESSLGAWIKTIQIRAALRIIQKRMQFETLDEQWEDKGQSLNGWMDGEMLDKSIRSLPAGCRSVFVLVEIEGYPHREAAALLNISEGTSKSQLSYAKKLLREKLNETLKV
ncbi:RNA polymerase sigma-70 factor (ECF subfamily) [Anseongella ginsenosidimutans]|uniref:RNA polymerase sigma-70 factor (ECF subfamily) n=1 Tax=Anseongella ginsenosidimutans TaxID=496056 RepID=A0A4V2UTH8_9SPHI|nr:RNA polymerase sigma factor [Anseongella ginsenosidimutans]QEC53681.1 RNA polymerase sigma factor [Anseongella ginsenosidimutans]TCS86069.1 RNA polymerase sigma-70 factor (ECF subfamily) [Anseongella ginsenosidimutans]